LIPIHAFPVINNEKDEIFPKLIDMGKKTIGQTYKKTIQIKCNAPVNFEYEMQYNVQHADIKIDPMFGDIKGMTTTDIDIYYTPTNYSTANAEV
jgi:hypothetical protein